MPVWEEEGAVYPQCSAILRMIGIRCGYYSEDPMACWAIDSLVDYIEDHTNKFAAYLFPVTKGEQVSDDASGWFSDYWEKVMPLIEKRMAEHGKPFVGGTDSPSIADFKAFASVSVSLSDCNSASVVPAAV